MIARLLGFAVAVLAVVALLAGCGGDEETTTVTVTTTAAESQPPPTGPAVAALQQVTTAAVKEMQTALGVTADWIYGEETHTALKDKASSITVQIQTALATYGYYTGDIDGTYGPETAAAVPRLQTDLGVTADGRFGPETAAAFNEAVASGELQPA
jgi:peptidoglycan hydrolase-like protein with peptidoglycan-binding domain